MQQQQLAVVQHVQLHAQMVLTCKILLMETNFNAVATGRRLLLCLRAEVKHTAP
jgi:hypothetical protein